jgi:predicted nuclease of predicted toxin-antitoxin system
LKLKIDENLPSECAGILRGGGFEADTVADERLMGAEDSAIAVSCRAKGRVPIALDLGSSVEETGQTRRPRSGAKDRFSPG